MWNLIKIVVPRIQAQWENFAFSMQYKIGTIQAIREDCKDSEKCCKRLLEDWLTTSNGVTPKTWSELLKRIKDVNSLTSTVTAIEEELKSIFT